MRAFISLELPKAGINHLTAIQEQLKLHNIKMSWLKPELFHITLAFFANINKHEILVIQEKLREIVYTRRSISISLDHLDAFPNSQQARVIYVALGGEIKKMKHLSDSLRSFLEREHIDFDKKPFIPHVTIGRSKHRLSLTNNEIDISDKSYLLNTLTFFRSDLTTNGSQYTKLTEIQLAS